MHLVCTTFQELKREAKEGWLYDRKAIIIHNDPIPQQDPESWPTRSI